MSSAEQITTLESRVREVVGNFDMRDRHIYHAVRRKVLFVYLYRTLNMPKKARTLAIAAHYNYTAPAIRYIIKTTIYNMSKLLKRLPAAEGLLFSENKKWYIGSIHKLLPRNKYLKILPRVARSSDYDVAYTGHAYEYIPRQGSILESKMLNCGKPVVVTDVKRVDEEVVGVYIAQDAGDNLYLLSEFEY